jgi:hypothetical protein
MTDHLLRSRPLPAPRCPPSKHKFTAEEDMAIMDMVSRMSDPDWGLISDCLGTRSARQCRERWRMYLHPVINADPWTAEEDQILRREHATMGPRWTAIALLLPGRTEVHVKNRWTKLCRGKGRRRHRKLNPSPDSQQPNEKRVQFPPISQLCLQSTLWPGRTAEFRWDDVTTWSFLDIQAEGAVSARNDH